MNGLARRRLFRHLNGMCGGRTQLVTILRHNRWASTESINRPSSPPKESQSKHEWLVILPDHPNAANKRKQYRPQHLNQLSEIYPADFLLCGGPYLEKPCTESGDMEMLGSMIIASATSPSAVETLLKKDVFTKQEVWDWENVKIMPFKSTIRRGLESS